MCPHSSSEGEGLKKKVSPFGGDLEGANYHATLNDVLYYFQTDS